MPIRTPGKHFYSDSPIKAIIEWRKSRRSRKNIVATLMLTSMIDVFAVLVLFLLQNFSATGEVLFVQKDIKLPQAKMATEVERAPVITISKTKITLEGDVVGDSFIDRVDKLDEQNWEIKLLAKKLSEMRETKETANFQGKINIQADKELPFILIKQVMYTCTIVGYTNINFAVFKESESIKEEAVKKM